jgi:ribosome biogenesis protein MAK21
MLGDDEDLPSDFEGLGDETEEKDEKKEKSDEKKKKKRKLKHLPTFASMDDYAKLLGADDDEDR